MTEIMVRGANWIGDAVMTLPALAAVRAHFPQARLTVLTRPWAAGIYQAQAGVAQVITYEPDGRHRGLAGALAMTRELARFDLALLFQNAFSAALFPALARVPERWGYARDGRGWLLTRAVRPKPLDLAVHQVFYYLNLLEKLGLPAPYRAPALGLNEAAQAEAGALLKPLGPGPYLALAPGAAFGPAKRWPEAAFARAARLILGPRPGGTVILGGAEEAPIAARLAKILPQPNLNLAGRTSLPTAMTVLSRAGLLLTNDSGLMHLGGALGVPLVAVFGPTDPDSTAPLGRSRLIRSRAACAPCQKRVCPLDRQICFDEITPEAAAETALEFLESLEMPARGGEAVFIDPEGVLADGGTGGAPPGVLRPGAAEALAALTRQGRIIFLGGPPDEALRTLLIEGGVKPEALCFQAEQTGGSRRAADTLAMDLDRSIWISGRPETLAPASLPGARSILIPQNPCRRRTGEKIAVPPTLTAPDLKRAVEWILA